MSELVQTEPQDNALFVHRKSGKAYFVLYVAMNANNGEEGKHTVVYREWGGTRIFTRDKEEWATKFRPFTSKDLAI